MRLLTATLLVVLFTACPDKDKPKPAAEAPIVAAKTVQTLAPVAPLANSKPFTFSGDGSKVGFIGAKITGKHVGGFKAFTGAVDLVENELTKSRIRVDLEMATVFTDSEKLTGHLQSPDFFGVEVMPQARFVSTAIAQQQGNKYDVTGELTLHGVTKSITFPAHITMSDTQLDAAAEFTINRKDFGIVYPGKPDDLISDDVQVTLEIHAKP